MHNLEVRNRSFSTSCITLLQNCLLECDVLFYFLGSIARSEPRSPPCPTFTITLRHTTLDRTPLDEWSACRRDFYLTTNNAHKRQTPMPPAGFDPAILAGERPQTHALTLWSRNYFFLILAHPVYKMWKLQEPNKLELWNKLHFEEEKKNGEYIPRLKYSVPIFVE